MKSKIILCLTFLLSSVSVFALAYSIQLKPAAMSQHRDILIRSVLDAGCRSYCVVLLPQTEFPISVLKGYLEINDGTNRLASCPIDGITLSKVSAKGWGGMEKNEYYRAMTNRFSRPLNGAKIFNFQVATNLLAASTFSVGESSGGSASSRWFYLKDFSDAALPPSGVVAADVNNHPLKLLLSKSDLVVLGTITNEPIEFEFESGVPNYVCEFQVADVLKGDSKLKGRTISINILRFEMGAKDKHPLIKKDGECILFLKRDTPHGSSWVTTDFWFGVQHPSPSMARDLKQMASEK